MAPASRGDEVAVTHFSMGIAPNGGENRVISGCRQGVPTILCLVPPHNRARRESRPAMGGTSDRHVGKSATSYGFGWLFIR